MQTGYRLRLGSAYRELCLNLEHLLGQPEERLQALLTLWGGRQKPGTDFTENHTPVNFIAILGRLLVALCEQRPM